jgi:hypothetical protein
VCVCVCLRCAIGSRARVWQLPEDTTRIINTLITPHTLTNVFNWCIKKT